MGVEFQDKKILLEGMVGEDQVLPLRDKLNELAPEPVEVDMTGCNDIHMAALQLLLAYQALHGVTYRFPEEAPFYKKAVEGFRTL